MQTLIKKFEADFFREGSVGTPRYVSTDSTYAIFGQKEFHLRCRGISKCLQTNSPPQVKGSRLTT